LLRIGAVELHVHTDTTHPCSELHLHVAHNRERRWLSRSRPSNNTPTPDAECGKREGERERTRGWRTCVQRG